MKLSLSSINQKLIAAQRCACWFWCCRYLEKGMNKLFVYNYTVINRT